MIFKPNEDTQRLKWVFSSCKNGAWGTEAEGETDIVCIRAADFDGRLGRLRSGERTLRSVDPETYEKLALRRGDIILEKSGGGEKQLVGRAAIYDGNEPSITSNFLARCRPARGMEPAYVNYLLLAIYNGRGTFPHLKQSTGIQNLDLASFLDIRVRVPSLDTQQRIARFLDEKTARIDGLIEKKRALLDRLAEKRLALVTRAVTKGLNPDTLMKSSGIDWLGGMTSNEFLQPTIHPAKWESIRLRWLSKRYAGGTPDTKNAAYWEGGTIPWLNSGAVNQGIITEPSGYITELALKESSAKWIPRGALVIALAGQGKTKAMVGYLDIRTTGNQSLAAVLPEKIDGKFLYWWLSSQYLTLRNLSSQDGRDGLNLDMIGSIVCPVPPPDTQRQIARFLDEKTAQIDGLIDKIEESQNLLEEYRSALITQAVTGQLAKL